MKTPILTLNIKGMSASSIRNLLDTVIWRTTQINVQANRFIQFRCSYTLFDDLLTVMNNKFTLQDAATLIKNNEEELLNTYIQHETTLLTKNRNINGRMALIKTYSPLFKTVDTLTGVHT